jgi:hypothetical protein
MAILGYARVSTNGQDLAGQVAALQARCVRIYREKASGAKTDRPELAKLLRALGPGDVPIVTRLDRLPLKLCCCSRRIAVASRAAFTSRPVGPYRARGTAPRYPPTRFRALAVFRRRPPQRVVRSSLPASENLHNSGPPGDANSTLTVPRHRRVSSDHRRRATMQAVLAPERHPIPSVPIGSTMLLFSPLHPAGYHTRIFYSRTGGTTMALYMAQFAYTPEAWTAFTKHPEDRTKAVQSLAQKLGCRFEALYCSLGEYDGFRHSGST